MKNHHAADVLRKTCSVLGGMHCSSKEETWWYIPLVLFRLLHPSNTKITAFMSPNTYSVRFWIPPDFWHCCASENNGSWKFPRAFGAQNLTTIFIHKWRTAERGAKYNSILFIFFKSSRVGLWQSQRKKDWRWKAYLPCRQVGWFPLSVSTVRQFMHIHTAIFCPSRLFDRTEL